MLQYFSVYHSAAPAKPIRADLPLTYLGKALQVFTGKEYSIELHAEPKEVCYMV